MGFLGPVGDFVGGVIDTGADIVKGAVDTGAGVVKGALGVGGGEDGVDAPGGNVPTAAGAGPESNQDILNDMKAFQKEQLEFTLALKKQEAEYNITKGLADAIKV